MDPGLGLGFYPALKAEVSLAWIRVQPVKE